MHMYIYIYIYNHIIYRTYVYSKLCYTLLDMLHMYIWPPGPRRRRLRCGARPHGPARRKKRKLKSRRNMIPKKRSS